MGAVDWTLAFDALVLVGLPAGRYTTENTRRFGWYGLPEIPHFAFSSESTFAFVACVVVPVVISILTNATNRCLLVIVEFDVFAVARWTRLRVGHQGAVFDDLEEVHGWVTQSPGGP